MPNRIYYIGIRWPDTVPFQVEGVENALGSLGDWIRLNALTWFCSTSASSKQIYEAVRGALVSVDQILIIALDTTDRFGLAPKWIWDWIDSQRQSTPNTLASILANVPQSRKAS